MTCVCSDFIDPRTQVLRLTFISSWEAERARRSGEHWRRACYHEVEEVEIWVEDETGAYPYVTAAELAAESRRSRVQESPVNRDSA